MFRFKILVWLQIFELLELTEYIPLLLHQFSELVVNHLIWYSIDKRGCCFLLQPVKIIQNEDIIEEELEISCGYKDSSTGLVYIGLQNITPLSRLGRIWSFIDDSILGGIITFKVTSLPNQNVSNSQTDNSLRNDVIGESRLVLSGRKYFDFRVLCQLVCSSHNVLLIGTHNGYIHILKTSSNEQLTKLDSSILIGNEEII